MVDADQIVCADVMTRMDLFLDHELDDVAAQEIRRHLGRCQTCSGEAEVGTAIRQAIKRSHHPEPAPPALLERVGSWLRDQQLRSAS